MKYKKRYVLTQFRPMFGYHDGNRMCPLFREHGLNVKRIEMVFDNDETVPEYRLVLERIDRRAENGKVAGR